MFKLLEDYIVDIKENVFVAHWKLFRNGRILLVESNGLFQGVVSFGEIKKSYYNPTINLSELCNKDCFYIEGDNKYEQAETIFARNEEIRAIPVINSKKQIVDLLFREQVFWKQYYRKELLPRMNYAFCIYNAAFEAKSLGYDSFSVIEFGVAGGNGLINCEFHAKEIERLLGVHIEIYGFDTSEGLPMSNKGYKDMIHIWPDRCYKMDRELLLKHLEKAQLVIGDINETLRHFMEDYSPSPVGCILIDVDRYSSTVPILKMLENCDNEKLMPRIYMYFDDISPLYEYQGEGLAIKEFNKRNELMKITPEGFDDGPDYKRKVKVCHRFNHEKYNCVVQIYDGLELTEELYELPLNINLFE